MKNYDLYLAIKGKGIKLEIKGEAHVSGLEQIAESAENEIVGKVKAMKEPAIVKGRKPALTKDIAYYWLEKGKDNEWFSQRYNFKKYQLAAYRAWVTMRRNE